MQRWTSRCAEELLQFLGGFFGTVFLKEVAAVETASPGPGVPTRKSTSMKRLHLAMIIGRLLGDAPGPTFPAHLLA